MDETTRQALSNIWHAIDQLFQDEGSDRQMTLEMTQTMLTDLLHDGELQPIAAYLRRYTYLSPDEADTMALAIADAQS